MRIDPLGQQVSHVIRVIDPPYRNCDIEVELIGGTKVATNRSYLELVDIHSA
jgi:hypothetical protein